MEQDVSTVETPPRGLDIDEGLDDYDKEVAESFPASDTPESAHP